MARSSVSTRCPGPEAGKGSNMRRRSSERRTRRSSTPAIRSLTTCLVSSHRPFSRRCVRLGSKTTPPLLTSTLASRIRPLPHAALRGSRTHRLLVATLLNRLRLPDQGVGDGVRVGPRVLCSLESGQGEMGL
jgi:hypothetical protein